MSQSDDYSDGEFETVIAAAAYAITSLEEGQEEQDQEREQEQEQHSQKKKQITSLEEKEKQGSQKKKQRRVEISETSQPKTKSKIEDNRIKLSSISGSFKRWFTDQEAKEDGKSSGDSFRRKSRTEEELVSETLTTSQTIKEKPINRTPSVKKTPTITDPYLNETASTRISGEDIRPSSEAPSAKKFSSPSFGGRRQDEYSAETSKADAWENAQMIKIKKRYDSMLSMILKWENEKKEKAKSRMERKRNAPVDIRAKAKKKYEDEKSRIEKVAGDARVFAEERKRNDEAKARTKAEKIRSTGKLPKFCWCF